MEKGIGGSGDLIVTERMNVARNRGFHARSAFTRPSIQVISADTFENVTKIVCRRKNKHALSKYWWNFYVVLVQASLANSKLSQTTHSADGVFCLPF